ncbi:hypothetical protein GF362_04650 [Candidatus Dojkabacteria bacterium]|nr:hypothetical protein [Candidatus Dojkabacteria bacterium]
MEQPVFLQAIAPSGQGQEAKDQIIRRLSGFGIDFDLTVSRSKEEGQVDRVYGMGVGNRQGAEIEATRQLNEEEWLPATEVLAAWTPKPKVAMHPIGFMDLPAFTLHVERE